MRIGASPSITRLSGPKPPPRSVIHSPGAIGPPKRLAVFSTESKWMVGGVPASIILLTKILPSLSAVDPARIRAPDGSRARAMALNGCESPKYVEYRRSEPSALNFARKPVDLLKGAWKG